MPTVKVRRPGARALTPSLVALLLPMTLALHGCGDDPARPNGENCNDDADCQSDLCLASLCVDPAGDEDGDGLENAREVALGTNGASADTDADGVPDGDEVGAALNAPLDFDGDGLIDAIESRTADADGDCLVDERDPDDTTSAGAELLADNGCCCDGKCSVTGWDTEASCAGGILTCTRPQPDRDADGIADRCDAAAFEIPFDEVGPRCAAACARIAEDCGRPREGCETECAALTVDEGLWVANYLCEAEGCDAGACFGDNAGFPEPDGCTTGCDGLLGCGAGELFGVTDATGCRLACAAASTTDDGFAAQVACLGGLAGVEGCTALDVTACFESADVCGQACARLSPGHERACAASAPIFASFADAGTCREACRALSGTGQARFFGCVAGSGCSAPEVDCTAVGAETDGYCAEACGAMTAACGFENPVDPLLCQAICEGFRPHVPWSSSSAAAACLTEKASGCAEGIGPALGTLLECMAQTSPNCADYCAFAASCSEQSDPNCRAFCTIVELEQPERIAATASCVEGLESCEGLLACFAIQPAAVCQPGCAQRLECDPGAFETGAACVQSCAQGMGLVGTGFGRWVCEAVDSGCDTGCAGLTAATPSAECIAACVGTDACHAWAYGLCEQACMGLETEFGGALDVECLPEALGPLCDLAGARAACVSE